MGLVFAPSVWDSTDLVLSSSSYSHGIVAPGLVEVPCLFQEGLIHPVSFQMISLPVASLGPRHAIYGAAGPE